ncbi:MAG: hypothetical protein QM708_04145 [Propioniciclava sp.]|uniref:hypothetical protein n=1 Tax=Propioniciclava sp. TaxID=2038686 RepID=UPI0039E2F143
MSRISDWMTRNRTHGRVDVKEWALGTAGPAGFTYGTHYVVTGLMVLAIVLYPLTQGIGSIVAVSVAIVAMAGRRMLENQVRRDFSDLEEAKTQYQRTRNAEYLEFIRLRVTQMLNDNKMLRPETKQALIDYVEWAEKRAARDERRRGA